MDSCLHEGRPRRRLDNLILLKIVGDLLYEFPRVG